MLDNVLVAERVPTGLSTQGAIGVFDSGVGGLSVALAIRQLLPHEDILYIADTAHAPYGNKDDDYIFQRMLYLTQFMIEQGVKAVVVACNTATTAAISKLRAVFAVPIIGVEPGVKPAVLASKSGIVGVLATPRTLLTPAFATLAQRFITQGTVLLQPCPELVPLIEALQLHDDKIKGVLKEYMQPLLDNGADTLVLGCTHYNFVADVITEIAGPHINIIRTEMAVAKELQRRLYDANLLNNKTEPAVDAFYTSGNIAVFNLQLQHLWQVGNVKAQHLY